MKMKVDIPQCKRCCLCVPLRHGLIVWGYLKVICDIIGMSFSVVYIINSLKDFACVGPLGVAILLVSIVDIILTGVFIVGAHMKNLKIFKVYYYYSTIEGAIIACLVIGQLSWLIYLIFDMSYGFFSHFVLFCLSGIFAILVLSLLIQLYLICLLRSEIIKLESNVQVKFVSVASEGKCDVVLDKEKMEKRKYDRLEDDNICNV